jgi:hypothetical protein
MNDLATMPRSELITLRNSILKTLDGGSDDATIKELESVESELDRKRDYQGVEVLLKTVPSEPRSGQ